MDLTPSGRRPGEILEDAVAGRRITAGDAHTLLLDCDLLELGVAAAEVRNRHNDPEIATYNIDRNINYTNVCVYKCRFCAFYRRPKNDEAYVLEYDEIGRKIDAAKAVGADCVAVATGGYDESALREAGATTVVPDLLAEEATEALFGKP